MGLSDAFAVSHLIEAVLNGKQPLAPILANLRAALKSMLKAIDEIESVLAEIEAARK